MSGVLYDGTEKSVMEIFAILPPRPAVCIRIEAGDVLHIGRTVVELGDTVMRAEDGIQVLKGHE